MHRGAAVTTMAVMLLAAGPAAAQTPVLPTGKAKDVLIKPSANGGVISFHRKAAAAFNVIAGRKIDVSCTKFGRESNRAGIQLDTGSSSHFRAPKRRRPFRIGFDVGKYDYCTIARSRFSRKRGNIRSTFSARRVATVPLSQRGAVYVDERDKTALMFRVVATASLLAEKRKLDSYPTAQEIQRATRGAAVPLTAADASPPPGKLGVFVTPSSLTVSTLSAVGRRLYVEFGDDERVSTNVLEYLEDDE